MTYNSAIAGTTKMFGAGITISSFNFDIFKGSTVYFDTPITGVTPTC